MNQSLERIALRTSRLMDFCSRKELIAQTGHQPDTWPLVVLKELVDNALDACEEARVAPEIEVVVNNNGITVADNGPGIPETTIKNILDFSVRVSSREAYVAPDRGAQGNALKTILAIPFVLDGAHGRTIIRSHGDRHDIDFAVDTIRQEPVVSHQRTADDVRIGSTITVIWPELASSHLEDAKARFLQIAADYTWLNPHLALTVEWFGEQIKVAPTAPDWDKWRPSDATSAHWYSPQHLDRLIAGYIAHDQDHGSDRTVREFISEFRGLSGSRKQKAVLEATGLARTNLSGICSGSGVDGRVVEQLLEAMKAETKPVKPAALGVVGKDHLHRRLRDAGCEMESFQYRKVVGDTDGVPWIVETAFAWCPDAESRRLVTGVNWSPGIINPFRALGQFGESLDTILSQQRADMNEPIVLVLHMACPRVEYTDRGKSAVVVEN